MKTAEVNKAGHIVYMLTVLKTSLCGTRRSKICQNVLLGKLWRVICAVHQHIIIKTTKWHLLGDMPGKWLWRSGLSPAVERGSRAAATQLNMNESMVRKWRKQEHDLCLVQEARVSTGTMATVRGQEWTVSYWTGNSRSKCSTQGNSGSSMIQGGLRCEPSSCTRTTVWQ